ncbi:STY0301 family protein [Aquabacter spiritensis]|uniref:Uncharacterized protein n=1 Tax=Aquabacter spiritensis TaxID=933073 RepID=A0A4R3M5Z3_9HYPH|nr:STY0301 family protein [Aquabacter spiritensis]TCT07679.1 hypothetical protein EDC64_101198 [Aquabacter spiritensis]
MTHRSHILVLSLIGTLWATAAQAQALPCPSRLKTVAAKAADTGQISDFSLVVGGETSSQTWLQDIALFRSGETTPLKGTEKGKRRIDWTFAAPTDVTVACVYEAGVVLTRAVSKVKGCSAAIERSKDGGEGWGMGTASFTCR